MRAAAVVALAGLLVGCAAPGPPAAPQRVEIPVSAGCAVEVPHRPTYAVDALPLGAPIDAQMRALRAERQQRAGYEIQLEAVVRKCVGPPLTTALRTP